MAKLQSDRDAQLMHSQLKSDELRLIDLEVVYMDSSSCRRAAVDGDDGVMRQC